MTIIQHKYTYKLNCITKLEKSGEENQPGWRRKQTPTKPGSTLLHTSNQQQWKQWNSKGKWGREEWTKKKGREEEREELKRKWEDKREFVGMGLHLYNWINEVELEFSNILKITNGKSNKVLT